MGSSAVLRDDLATAAERLVPFSPRGRTRKRLEALAGEYDQRLSRLHDLLNGDRLSCPICESCDNVIITGNGRDGAKKFLCRAHHDLGSTGRDSAWFRFSTYTSLEALKVYQDFLVEALTLLTTCEGTYQGIAKYLNISRHMVELSVQTLLDYLGDSGDESIRVDDDLAVIYADFSGTRVSRSASVIMSRIGGSIAYQVCCTMNYMTAWNFVRGLKKRLEVGEDATLVFVTDGEAAWIDPIRSFFPDAVHVRQFHSKNCKGLIYVHLPYPGNQGHQGYQGNTYTVRLRWDAVLGEGEANREAVRMRRRRKLERSVNAESRGDRTELSDEIIVWEGIAKYPRGTRSKEGKGEEATVAGAIDEMDEENQGNPGNQGQEPGEERGEKGFEDLYHDSERFEEGSEEGVGEDKSRGSRGSRSIASGSDGAKRIFRGKLEDGLRIPVVRSAFTILAALFGGLYISSNIAESLFNIKPALRSHRTVKSGDAFVQLLIFLRTRVKGWSRERIKSFFRDEVAMLDRLRTVTVRRKGLPGDRVDPREVVLDAYRNGDPVTICYRDRNRRRTSRMIEPLQVEIDQYTGMKRIKSYCYLRGEERTFLLDRVVAAIPADTDLSIISPIKL